MRRTVVRSTLLALMCLGWAAAQDGSAKSTEKPAGQQQEKSGTPQSLPPGPLGLQPEMLKPSAVDPPASTAKSSPATPGTSDPLKMAAPPASGPGGKIPGTLELDQKTYVIGAEDVISVIVWGQSALTGNHVVRPDGRISVPLAGEIQATGLTPQQLEAAIAARLKDANLILDPHVSVGLTAVHSKKYFINGEVNHPGGFDLVVPTTVMEALVSAGGFKDFANKKHIYILRGNKQLRFNWNDAVKGKHPEQNIYLEDRDIIVIN